MNPGSIGMPYGCPGGSWALLRDGQVALRHTHVDADDAVDAIIGTSTYPDRASWADYFIRARASDTEALTVFGPRDGRQ